MTVYVETDFLLALAKDTDWLQGSAENALGEYDVETSPFSYLELLLAENATSSTTFRWWRTCSNSYLCGTRRRNK